MPLGVPKREWNALVFELRIRFSNGALEGAKCKGRFVGTRTQNAGLGRFRKHSFPARPGSLFIACVLRIL